MKHDQIQATANDLLGLGLSAEDAADLAGPLTGLGQLVRLIEQVPLPYSATPFITPRIGDDWVERWPDPGLRQDPRSEDNA